ncbi:hypothetical protein [Rhizobium leguminosarum]|nr:hypothetical protein [Rhizobium leguminosarum]
MFADASIIDAYVEEYKAESKRIAAERRNSLEKGNERWRTSRAE